MMLKKLILQQPNTQIVILSLTILSIYLMSHAGASAARTLPAGKETWENEPPLETLPGTVPMMLAAPVTPPLNTVTSTKTIINLSPPNQLELGSENQDFVLYLPNIQRQWQKIIQNQDFTQTLYLDEGDNDTLILNATFHDINGSAIMLRNVSNVYIKNCIIHDVAGDGIVLRSTGSTYNITIDGCTIYNTGLNGILAKQQEATGVDHLDLVIRNNTLYNIGTTGHDHGMYIFSTDSVIEHNVVYGSTGNGISIRSSGLIQGNKIWDTQKSCIRYFSDHARGASNTLVIENNLCYQRETGTGSAGIGLSQEEFTSEEWLVGAYTIRFNTVVQLTGGRYGFSVDSPIFSPKRVEVYGNLFVNTQTVLKTIKPNYIDYSSSNYKSVSLEEFVNPNQPLHGFQLRNNSRARAYASAEPQVPTLDINGILRPHKNIDAGAYQVSSP